MSPKEVIHTAQEHHGPEEQVTYPFAVTVGWNKDLGFAQIGVENVNLPVGERERGWFTDLSRPECNRLIRALRKARDGAYGADE